MPLRSVAAGACSSQSRNVIQKSLGIQQRNAATQVKPVMKAAQSMGGVTRGKNEKWQAKINRERTHRRFDIPIYTRLSEDKLRRRDEKKTLPELFRPGSSHSLEYPLFTPETVVKRNIGSVVSFDMSPKSPGTAFGLPEKMFLEYRILSAPCSVIRDATVDTVKRIDEAKGSSSKDSRLVLTGRAGCGKSFLLHQAVQYAQQQGWIVFYVPKAVTLMNSSSRHIYDLRTQTYVQPAKSFRCVDRLYRANGKALSQIKLSAPLAAEKLNVAAGTSLAGLAEILIKGKSSTPAPVVLETIMKELETQTQFPVLMAIDDLQALFHESAYKDPFFKPIQAHHLSVPRLLLEFASGKRNFANGAFMGALNSSDTTYTIPLELRDTLNLEYAHPTSPYEKRSNIHLEYAQGLKALKVPERMSVKEASSLFDVWKNDMALPSDRYDELFLSKYVEADGNPRDIVWKGLLSTFSP